MPREMPRKTSQMLIAKVTIQKTKVETEPPAMTPLAPRPVKL
jgi:hypothetical protein